MFPFHIYGKIFLGLRYPFDFLMVYLAFLSGTHLVVFAFKKMIGSSFFFLLALWPSFPQLQLIFHSVLCPLYPFTTPPLPWRFQTSYTSAALSS